MWCSVLRALTASSFGDERERIVADGCDDFLRKPFREAELFDMLHKHLGVQFIHECEDGETGQVPEPVVVNDLPAQLRRQLRQALDELNVDAVETVIGQIGSYDPKLANTLAEMAYRYQYDQMRELIANKAAAFD
jgi:hypothetical protein